MNIIYRELRKSDFDSVKSIVNESFGLHRYAAEKDNRSAEENELIKLKKENQQLKMENDILKQAGVTMELEKSK